MIICVSTQSHAYFQYLRWSSWIINLKFINLWQCWWWCRLTPNRKILSTSGPPRLIPWRSKDKKFHNALIPQDAQLQGRQSPFRCHHHNAVWLVPPSQGRTQGRRRRRQSILPPLWPPSSCQRCLLLSGSWRRTCPRDGSERRSWSYRPIHGWSAIIPPEIAGKINVNNMCWQCAYGARKCRWREILKIQKYGNSNNSRQTE